MHSFVGLASMTSQELRREGSTFGTSAVLLGGLLHAEVAEGRSCVCAKPATLVIEAECVRS